MLSVACAPPATPKLIPRDQPLERRAPLIRTGMLDALARIRGGSGIAPLDD